MKVLVTGGSGFIGQYVVEELQDRDIEVTVFDRHGKWRTDGIDIILGDTRDYVAVKEAIGVHDGVIHLAGVLGTQETIRDPRPAAETNVQGGLNVFLSCRDYEVPCTYISVGNYWMNNSYSITKNTAERFAYMFNKESGADIAVVRALNAYGPRQKANPVRKIMPNFILPALRGEKLQVYGDGSQIMDMIYVADVAYVLVEALLADDVGRSEEQKIDAGTGRRTTVKDIAEEVIRQVGGGWIEYLPMRPGEPEHSVVLGDPDTLDQLGVSPYDFIQLEEGISRTIKYYESLSFSYGSGV